MGLILVEVITWRKLNCFARLFIRNASESEDFKLMLNVYRTPSCSPLVFLNSLNDLLIEFSDHDKNILMMGDFNINLKSSD